MVPKEELLQSECPLVRAIMSGLADDVMFRMFDDMAKIRFPVEETAAVLRQKADRDLSYRRKRRVA